MQFKAKRKIFFTGTKGFSIFIGGFLLGALICVSLMVRAYSDDKEIESVDFNQAKKITIDFDGLNFEVKTKTKTVAELLSSQNIVLEEDDFLFPAKESVLQNGTLIKIQRKTPALIKVDGKEMEHRSFAETVEEALREEGISLNNPDIVEPGLKSKLTRNSVIKITRVEIEEVTETDPIDFKVVEKDDATLKWRTTKVSQEGTKGEKETVYKIRYENGKQVSKTKLSTEVAKEPQNKVILHGTKIEVGKVSKGRASWYSFTGEMKCASLEHPIGTWLRVTNRATGKSIIVQVNDRGPFSKDKIIDLDEVAFKKIGNLGQGVLDVKVEEILN